jgi:hypothetical protein
MNAMKRLLPFSVAAALTLGACSDVPTTSDETPRPDFILNGAPDAGEHPYVAFVLFYDAVTPGWFRCSGSLLDATTVLTAGHCTYEVGLEGVVPGEAGEPGYGSGGNDIWVTFDEQVNLAGFPSRGTLSERAFYEARRDYLNNPSPTPTRSIFIRGTSLPHPDFDGFPGTNFPNTTDIGVIELSAAAPVTDFAELPEENALLELEKHQIFDIVGYGLQDAKPVVGPLIRTKGQAMLGKLEGPFAAGVNLPLSNNNGTPHRGGICSGDSGGPVLLGDVVYGVHSFGRIGCKGAGYSYRTDIEQVLDFVLAHVE